MAIHCMHVQYSEKLETHVAKSCFLEIIILTKIKVGPVYIAEHFKIRFSILIQSNEIVQNLDNDIQSK